MMAAVDYSRYSSNHHQGEHQPQIHIVSQTFYSFFNCLIPKKEVFNLFPKKSNKTILLSQRHITPLSLSLCVLLMKHSLRQLQFRHYDICAWLSYCSLLFNGVTDYPNKLFPLCSNKKYKEASYLLKRNLSLQNLNLDKYFFSAVLKCRVKEYSFQTMYCL